MCTVLYRVDSQWRMRKIRKLSIHFKALQRASKGNLKSQSFRNKEKNKKFSLLIARDLGTWGSQAPCVRCTQTAVTNQSKSGQWRNNRE